MDDEFFEPLVPDDPTEEDLISIPDKIKTILERVENDFYWEDGGFINGWLQDDLYALLRAATLGTNK